MIIPCYNEAAVIRQTVESVCERGYSVVVVDDASVDGSLDKLADLPIIRIRHRVNLGQGAAIQTGIDAAKMREAVYFVTFDADGQHRVEDIGKMIGVIREKQADIVFGSRFLEGARTNISKDRSRLLNIARYVNYFFSGVLLSDAHNGLRCMNRRAADTIRLKENRMAHATEFLIQAAKEGLKIAECPVHIEYTDYSRKKGQGNKQSLQILIELILNKLFR